jgi:hypothetical protein
VPIITLLARALIENLAKRAQQIADLPPQVTAAASRGAGVAIPSFPRKQTLAQPAGKSGLGRKWKKQREM